jgi:hypothetical protein
LTKISQKYEDEYEKIWPKNERCPCSSDDKSRHEIIIKAMNAAEVLHQAAQELGICKTMYPHFVGLVSAFSIGFLEQSLNTEIRGLSLLSFPENLSKLSLADQSARAACESSLEGTRAARH